MKKSTKEMMKGAGYFAFEKKETPKDKESKKDMKKEMGKKCPMCGHSM